MVGGRRVQPNLISYLTGTNKISNEEGHTVLQIQVYPKKNAPEVSKPPRVAKRDFLLILKIFSNLDDIQPSN